MVVLDEILAKVMVDELGVKTTLRIVEKADEVFAQQHPQTRLNVDFVRLAGAAKIDDLEQREEDATNGKDTKIVSAQRTPSCKDSRRNAMLRHDQALKAGMDEVAKAGFRAGT